MGANSGRKQWRKDERADLHGHFLGGLEQGRTVRDNS